MPQVMETLRGRPPESRVAAPALAHLIWAAPALPTHALLPLVQGSRRRGFKRAPVGAGHPQTDGVWEGLWGLGRSHWVKGPDRPAGHTLFGAGGEAHTVVWGGGKALECFQSRVTCSGLVFKDTLGCCVEN